MNKNEIDCNYTKTNFVVFEKRSANHSNILFWDHEISSVDSFKYLGLHFDRKLNFEIHIENVIAKLARKSGILHKLRETLNRKQLVQYVRTYITPLVHYAVLLYGLGPKTRFQKIILLQKKTNLDSFTASCNDQCYRNIQRAKRWNSF